MTPRQAEAVAHYRTGISVERVADLMGICGKNVRKLLHKAGEPLRGRHPVAERQPPADSFWTDERVAELRRMFTEEGASSGTVAKALGATRSQVISKARRLDIKLVSLRQASDDRRAAKRVAEKQATSSVKIGVGIDHTPGAASTWREAEFVGPLMPLAALSGWHCRWPIGDPRSDTFGFCAWTKSWGDDAYCRAHRQRASSPVQKPIRVRSDSTPIRYAARPS